MPCADRLAELRVGMPSAGADIEAGVPGSSSQSPAMASFFDEVSAVKKSMQTIKYNIKLIEQSHGECLTAISSEQQRECTDRLEGLMKETNGAAQTVTLPLALTLTLTLIPTPNPNTNPDPDADANPNPDPDPDPNPDPDPYPDPYPDPNPNTDPNPDPDPGPNPL